MVVIMTVEVYYNSYRLSLLLLLLLISLLLEVVVLLLSNFLFSALKDSKEPRMIFVLDWLLFWGERGKRKVKKEDLVI